MNNNCSVNNLKKLSLAILKIFSKSTQSNIIDNLKSVLSLDKTLSNEEIMQSLKSAYEILRMWRKNTFYSFDEIIEKLNSENNSELLDDKDNGEKEKELDGYQQFTTIRNFIYLTYGLSSMSDLMLMNFNDLIVSAFIYDGNTFINFKDDTIINNNIRSLQENLLLNIINYLRVKKPDLYPFYENKTIYDENGLYTGVVEDLSLKLAEEFKIGKGNITDFLNAKYALKDSPTSFNTSLWVDAFNSLFILNNFDRLISSRLKKAIKIKKYSAKFSNEDKYSINKTQNITTSWSDEDFGIDLTKEIGDFDRLIISTRLRYDKDSNVIPGRRLQFDEFNSIITKVLQIYNSNKRNVTLEGNDIMKALQPFIDVYGEDVINDIIKDENQEYRTIGLLIALSSLHPTDILPILYTVIPLVVEANYFTNNEWEVFYSIKYNFLDISKQSSFYNTHVLYFGYENDYYNYIIQLMDSLSPLELMQYKEDEPGKIKNLTLKTNSLDSSRWNLELKLNGIISGNINLPNNISITTENFDDKKFEKQRIVIELKNNDDIYKWYINPNGNKIILNNNENELNNEEKIIFFETFLPFFRELTYLQLTKTSLFVSNFSNADVLLFLNFISSALYNKKVQEYLDSKRIVGDEINKYLPVFYGEDYASKKIRLHKVSLKIMPITDNDAPILSKLASINDILSGRYTQNMVKDAENKLLTSIGLAMIATNFRNQIELIEKAPNSASKHFSFFKLFKGVEFVRDFYGIRESKKAKDFSHAEIITALLYDFFDINDPKQLTFRIMPDVISDKDRLIRAILDKNAEINGKKFSDLSYEEIKELARVEFLLFYLNIFNNSKNKFDNLNNSLYSLLNDESFKKDWADSIRIIINNNINELFEFILYEERLLIDDENGIYETPEQVVSRLLNMKVKNITEIDKQTLVKNIFYKSLNFDNNFLYFNKLLSYNNEENFLYKILHDLFIDSGVELKFDIDKGYGIDAQINKNLILRNSFIEEQISRWSSVENTDLFFHEKEALFISDLIYHNIYFRKNDLYGNPIKNKGFSSIFKDNTYHGKLVLGTIHESYFDGEEQKLNDLYITDKFSIYNYDYNLVETNPDSPTFDILKYIEYRKTVLKNRILNNIANKFGFRNYESLRNSSDNDFDLRRDNLKLLFEEDKVLYNEQLKNLQSDLLNEEAIEKLKRDFEKKENGYKEALEKLNLEEEEFYKNRQKFIDEYTKDLDLHDFYSAIDNLLNSIRDNVSIEFNINPHLRKFNAVDFFIGREFLYALVGTHLGHPGSGEYAKYMQSVKRNVSETAAKHKFVLNTINGISDEFTVAVYKNPSDNVWVITGEPQETLVDDGCIIEDGITNYHENNSLGDSRAGFVKKIFVHDKNADSGSGVIVKCASFPVTNQTIRDSKVHQRINKKQLSRKYIDNNGQLYIPDITQDYNNETIDFSRDFGEIIYYSPKENCYYKVKSVIFDKETNITTVKRAKFIKIDDSDDSYEELNIIDDKDDIKFVADNNYDIWRYVFGGEWSCKAIKNNIGNNIVNFELSEHSFLNMAELTNRLGIRLNNNKKLNSLKYVYQFAKKSLINYFISQGAIKQGSANVNDSALLYDDDYVPATMKLKMHDSGIQLDAEHHADESVLSMMTQVVNALGARGYTADVSNGVYQALRALARYHLSDVLDKIKGKEQDVVSFNNAITKIIVDAILSSSNQSGDLIISNISDNLHKIMSDGKTLTYETINNEDVIMPLSHPKIFRKLMSNISSKLTKKCVRLKFPGIMCVLNPSHSIFKLYDDRLLGSYKGRWEEHLELRQKQILNISHSSEIEMGKSYKVLLSNNIEIPAGSIIKMNPGIYWKYRSLVNDKSIILQEDLASGMDLASLNITFEDINGEKYNIWDLYDVQLRVLNLRDESVFLLMQESLNGLSKYNPHNTVRVIDPNSETGYKDVYVNKNSIKHYAYETVLPQVFATQFGLRKGDEVKDIVNNPNFFVKRILENYLPKIDDEYFDFELKLVNGQHIYIMSSLRNPSEELLKNKVDILIETEIKDNKVNYYQIDDITGERVRLLSSRDDAICIAPDGITEVIITKNPEFFIEQHESPQLLISKKLADYLYFKNINKEDYQFNELFEILEKSDKTKNLAESLKLTSNENKAEGIHNNISFGFTKLNLLKNTVNEILEGNTNLTHNSTYYLAKQLIKNARLLHASFLSSLKVLVARIPAQSHLSFMAMKIVAFNQDGLNNAYVSLALILLQGSDFDIDKASFLGRKFKNGIYVGWSPFFRINTIRLAEISENLPFPTGEKLNETISLELKLLQLFEQAGSSIDETQVEQNIDYNKYLQYYKKVKELITNINQARQTKNKEFELLNIIQLIQFLNRENYKMLFSDSVEETKLFELAYSIVDAHNMYFDKNNNVRDALINYISSTMYNISADPSNYIQGSISVDIPTKIVKDISKKSPSATRELKYRPGNVMSKIEMLVNTLTGKKNTGIVASAMKVFEAMSQYYYNVLNYGSKEEMEKLIINKEIIGRQIMLLANSYDKYNNSSISKDVNNALLNVDNITDAFILFSTMLSLSTDNAKDPILGKINATPEMINLYMAGISVGFDVLTLSNIIMSPIGYALNDLLKGNIFLGLNGLFNLNAAIKFIEDGPTQEIASFVRLFREDILAAFKGFVNIDEGKEINIVTELTKILKNSRSNDFLNSLKQIVFNKDKSSDDNSISDEDLLSFIIGRLTSFKNAYKEKQAELTAINEKINETNEIISLLNQLFEIADNSNSLDIIKKIKESENKLNLLKKSFRKIKITLNNIESLIKQIEKLSLSRDKASKQLKSFKIDRSDEFIKKQMEDYIISKGVSTYNENLFSNPYRTAVYYNFLDSIYSWYRLRELSKRDIKINDNIISPFEEIKKLNSISNEMQITRGFTALNQSLPNSVDELILFLHTFLNILSLRYKLFLKETNILENGRTPAYIEMLRNKAKAAINNFKKNNSNSLELDIVKYCIDDNYRQLVFDTYDTIKYFINPFRVVLNVPNYNGYLDSIVSLFATGQTINKYKILTDLSRKTIRDLNIVSKKDKLKTIRKIELFVDYVINIKFLSTSNNGYPIIIKNVTTKFYKDKSFTLSDKAETIDINLSTESGRATFKYWMENIVFPNLKKKRGVFNLLIADLHQEIINNLNSSNNESRAFTLSVDMSPKRESFDEIQLNLYRASLNQLRTMPSEYGNIFDLLFLYNIVVYNGQSSHSSFTNLIDKLDSEDIRIVNQYKKFILNFDFNKSILLDEDFDINELYTFVAPIIDPASSRANMGYVHDKKRGKMILVEKLEDRKIYSDEENDFLQFDDDFLDLQSEIQELIGDDYLENLENFELTLFLYGYKIRNYFDISSDFGPAYSTLDANIINLGDNMSIRLDYRDSSKNYILYESNGLVIGKTIDEFLIESAELRGHTDQNGNPFTIDDLLYPKDEKGNYTKPIYIDKDKKTKTRDVIDKKFLSALVKELLKTCE